MGCIISSQMDPTNPTYVKVDNSGAFYARIVLSYINSEGHYITEISEHFPTGASRRLDYNNNVTNIKFAIQIEVLIGVFNTVYTRELPAPGKNCFNISGVTVSPIITEYECPQVDSYVQVDCDGWFFTRFFVDYTTTFGQKISLSSGEFSIGMNRVLYYFPNIKEVSIKIQIALFIGTFRDVYNQTFTTPERRCFSVTGTVFNPSVRQIDCFE